MNDASPIDRVLAALKSAGSRVQPSGSRWAVQCPAHADRSPSLSIRVGRDGRVLLRCHAGCDSEDVLEALRLTWARPIPGELCQGCCANSVTGPDYRRAQLRPGVSIRVCPGPGRRAGPGPRTWRVGGVAHSPPTGLVLTAAGTFVFPERNAEFQCVGFGLRYANGRKGFIAGGRRGLVIPHYLDGFDGSVLIVEGPSTPQPPYRRLRSCWAPFRSVWRRRVGHPAERPGGNDRRRPRRSRQEGGTQDQGATAGAVAA